VLFLKSSILKTGLLNKSLIVIFSFVFLCVSASCSHAPSKPTGRDSGPEISSEKENRPQFAKSENEPWWKKPENEWLIATLIVIGIGISVGAAVMISSGAGGLNVRINK